MKNFDFLDVLTDSITSLPLRILAVWIACALGSNLILWITGEFEIWSVIFFPVILIMGLFVVDWWMFLAFPVLVALAVFVWNYLVLDGPGGNLIWMFALAGFVMIPKAFQENLGLGCLYLLFVAWFTVVAFNSRRDDPSSIDHV